jgi:hypothetical protein
LSVRNQDVRKQEEASSSANVKSPPIPQGEVWSLLIKKINCILKHLLNPFFEGLGRLKINNGK